MKAVQRLHWCASVAVTYGTLAETPTAHLHDCNSLSHQDLACEIQDTTAWCRTVPRRMRNCPVRSHRLKREQANSNWLRLSRLTPQT